MLPLACPDTATRVAGGRIPSHPRPVQPSPQWDRELMAQYRAQLSGPSINNPPSAFRPARLSTTSVEVESGLRLSASRSLPRLPSGPVAALIRLVAYGHRQCRRMPFQPHRSIYSHAATRHHLIHQYPTATLRHHAAIRTRAAGLPSDYARLSHVPF